MSISTIFETFRDENFCGEIFLSLLGLFLGNRLPRTGSLVVGGKGGVCTELSLIPGKVPGQTRRKRTLTSSK